ncbi:hypothetical protein ACI79P_19980 [Blastococcus sp. SYSU DS0510]
MTAPELSLEQALASLIAEAIPSAKGQQVRDVAAALTESAHRIAGDLESSPEELWAESEKVASSVAKLVPNARFEPPYMDPAYTTRPTVESEITGKAAVRAAQEIRHSSKGHGGIDFF